MNKFQTNEIELAKAFQVEELEERIEFGSWSASADDTGGTYTPSTGNFSGEFNGTVTYTITF